MVDAAFERAYTDEELRAIFEQADPQQLSQVKAQIVAVIADDPVQYSDTELTDLHRGLGIQEKHYSRLIRHMIEVLEAHGTGQELIDVILGRLAMYSNRITGMPNVDG